MASNFAFQPFGLSRALTVGVTPVTASLGVTQIGGSTTAVVAPTSCRVVNDGTAVAFLQFGPTAATTVGATTGMKMLSGTERVFGIKGQPFLVASSTGTVTLCVTIGEGL